jgi:hypothetical protein
MLVASLLRQAGSQVANGLAGHGGGVHAGNQAGKAFSALKGAITSGNSSGTRNALSDVRKLLSSAGAIGAANSVQNKLNSIGAALKSSSRSSGHVSSAPATARSSTIRRF